MFIRTHKSFAINFAKMNSLEGNLITINDHKIPVGQKYKAEFLNMINTGKKL
jgi:DNA-binding LytR/AlgR family response regulator